MSRSDELIGAPTPHRSDSAAGAPGKVHATTASQLLFH